MSRRGEWMHSHSMSWLMSRRSFGQRLGTTFVSAEVALRGRTVWAQEKTGASTTGATRRSLIAEHDGMTDMLGRIPLCKLTLGPGATLPDTFLSGPLVARVETGFFDV